MSVGPGVAFDRHSRGTFGDEEERSEGGSSESFSDLPHPRPLQSSRSPHTGFSRSRWGRGAAPASLAPAQDEEEERRGRGLTRTLPPLALPSGGRRGFGRQLSVDQTNFQSGFVSHHDRQLSTPPYSPEGRRRGESPAGSPVALPLSRMTTVSGVGSMHEVRDGSSGRQQGQDGTTGSGRGQGEEPSPAHSLEEFRRTLRAELGTPSDFGAFLLNRNPIVHFPYTLGVEQSTIPIRPLSFNLRIYRHQLLY